MTPTLPLPDDHALVVAGSLNAKPADRTLARSDVRPLQVIMPGEGDAAPAAYFDAWGDLGVSSLAWTPRRPHRLYACTGGALHRVDLDGGAAERLPVEGLKDVHEMTVVDGSLWIANTGRDEAIAVDLATERTARRVRLTPGDGAAHRAPAPPKPEGGDEGEVRVVNKFHLNQVFRGLDGHLYGLTHHVQGKQLVRQVAKTVLKSQGNGGVVRLDGGGEVPLDLRAPHSVHAVGDEQWLFDSGNFTVHAYDAGWRKLAEAPCPGWGRGADHSAELGVLYAGISETRKRYRGLIPSGDAAPNMVQAFRTDTREPAGRLTLNHVEQVNNVYLLPRDVARHILALPRRGEKL